jgi:hypothetical protein
MSGFAFLAAGAQPRFRGVPVLGTEELVDTIDDELWRIEHDRPAERVSAWDAESAREFTRSCLRSVCRIALEEAADDSLEELEQRIRARLGEQPTETLAYAADAFALARGRRPEEWNEPPLDGFGAPSAAATAANLGFVVAHVAGYAAANAAGDPSAYASSFDAERRRQRAWLAERLALALPPPA